MKSESRLSEMLILSMIFYRILRVRWASTIVGFPRVCFKLFIISMFRFLASWMFLLCPGFIL